MEMGERCLGLFPRTAITIPTSTMMGRGRAKVNCHHPRRHSKKHFGCRRLPRDDHLWRFQLCLVLLNKLRDRDHPPPTSVVSI